jgi:hypothetical protein
VYSSTAMSSAQRVLGGRSTVKRPHVRAFCKTRIQRKRNAGRLEYCSADVDVLCRGASPHIRSTRDAPSHLAIDDMAATRSTAAHCARRTALSRLVSSRIVWSCAFSDPSCDALHAAFQPPHSPLVSTSTDAAGTSAAIRTSALDGEKFREGNEICSSVKAPEAVIYLCHHSTTTTTTCSAFTSSLSPSPRATPLPHTQCCPQDYHGL